MQKNTAVLRSTSGAASHFTAFPSSASAPSTAIAAHHPAQLENPPSTSSQRRRSIGTCSCWAVANPHSQKAHPTPLTGCMPPTTHPQHVENTNSSLLSCLLTSATGVKNCAYVRSQRPHRSTA
ncbi:hypothetical protein TcG_13224 [Trypanosoma cruzi]|nr:hypothetical protein TcG_13224 [Trypanosoma cruzi]